MAKRNLPNAQEQQSPVRKQERDNALDKDSDPDSYKIAFRSALFLHVQAGEVELTFLDTEDNELSPKVVWGEGDGENENGHWDYDWGIKQNIPSHVKVSALQDNTQYDIRIERR